MNPEVDRPAQFVYLAQPIDLSRANPHLMAQVRECLATSVVYSPAGAWSVPADFQPGPDASLQRVNNAALESARAVFAVITGQASLGVPAEVAMAALAGTPVVLLVDHQVYQRSWFLAWLEQQPAVVQVYTYHIHSERDSQVYNASAAVGDVEVVQESTQVILTTSLGLQVDASDVADFVGWVSVDEVH